MKKISLAAFLLLPVLTFILAFPVTSHSQFTWPSVCEKVSRFDRTDLIMGDFR
jgi:hypothetical protein